MFGTLLLNRRAINMVHSTTFGRIFWVDNHNEFRSCPQFNNGTGDFDNSDYVSDWEDWEGVNYELLFNIHKSCLFNAWNHSNSLSLQGF